MIVGPRQVMMVMGGQILLRPLLGVAVMSCMGIEYSHEEYRFEAGDERQNNAVDMREEPDTSRCRIISELVCVTLGSEFSSCTR